MRSLIKRLNEAKGSGSASRSRVGSTSIETDVEISIKLSNHNLSALLRRKTIVLKIPDANKEKNRYTVSLVYGGKGVAEG